MSIAPKSFWNAKILGWELSRYGRESEDFLEQLAAAQSSSLRFRMRRALELIAPHAQGRRVLELGCGSALLCEKLMAAGADEYTGVDIAAAAVSAGNERIRTAGLDENARLVEADITAYSGAADIVFSLGLLDWLGSEEITAMFARYPKALFLHSFSERRPSLARLMHMAYVHIAYGRKTGAYVPRYWREKEIKAMCGRPVENLEILRDRRLSFGAFVCLLSKSGK